MSETAVMKPYELRKLCAGDIFPMTKIISKIGIKEFKECFDSDEVRQLIEDMTTNKETSKADVSKIGMTVMIEIAGVVLNNLSECEQYIYQLLAGLSGMSKKDIKELPMEVFVEMIYDVIKKDEFKDFVKAVSKLIK